MKTAIVTGGSRGIGKAICLKLAEDGYHVVINYVSNDEAAAKTLAEITDKALSAEILKFDISNMQAVTSALTFWIESNPDKKIEVLVNNAGVRRDNLLVFMTNEEIHNVISTNLGSFFFITRLIVKEMILNKYGRIINIVSLSGLKGLPGQTNYSAAKAGVIGATKALAHELGKKKITVNAVAPGYIRTDMTADLNEAELKSLIPLNRFGEAKEVAELVSFLASEKSSYITGQVISINGGLYT